MEGPNTCWGLRNRKHAKPFMIIMILMIQYGCHCWTVVLGILPTIFQILLTTQACSEFWEQQLGGCYLVQFRLLCTWKKPLWDLTINIFEMYVPILGLSFKAYWHIIKESIYVVEYTVQFFLRFHFSWIFRAPKGNKFRKCSPWTTIRVRKWTVGKFM
jgi:hypothetical protein